MNMTIEQTMQAHHLAVRERLGMGVRVVRATPLRISPPARPEPPKRDLVTSSTVINTDATWRQIIKEVTDKHNVSIPELMGMRRSRNFIAARREVAWRLLTERHMSYAAIARRLGYEDHSSILNLIAGYEKANGCVRRNSKAVLTKKREVRNQEILRRLNAGAFVAELAREYEISTNTIRSIAHSLGFSFTAGADARRELAMQAIRQRNRVERQAKWDAQKDRTMRNKEELEFVKGLSEKYFSVGEAAEAIGMPYSTLRFKAKKHNIVFRNAATRIKAKMDWLVEAPEIEG